MVAATASSPAPPAAALAAAATAATPASALAGRDGPDQMPEPDAVIRGLDTNCVSDLPTVAAVLCVIEVANPSLESGRGKKLPIYARAGVPEYGPTAERRRLSPTHRQWERHRLEEKT